MYRVDLGIMSLTVRKCGEGIHELGWGYGYLSLLAWTSDVIWMLVNRNDLPSFVRREFFFPTQIYSFEMGWELIP